MYSSLFLLSAWAGNAQWKADGTALTTTFTMKDLNNNSYDLFTMLNAGKHVIMDLSATWCGPCWSYHSTHVLDNYYDKYGPTGTSVKDAQVFLYEVDPSTTLADVNGTTSATQGNWAAGTTHPICNETSTSSVVGAFLAPGTTSYGVPAVFVVCKNKQLYKISTGITTEAGVRSFVASKCGVGPLQNGEVMDMGFSYNLYPNPASDESILHLNLEEELNVSLDVINSLGQKVYSVNPQLMTGMHDVQLPTASWANGMYFLKLQAGKRNVQARLLVQH